MRVFINNIDVGWCQLVKRLFLKKNYLFNHKVHKLTEVAYTYKIDCKVYCSSLFKLEKCAEVKYQHQRV